jgi:ribose/xylose/arabinose/galactoside ABC-type transport system permease subunit
VTTIRSMFTRYRRFAPVATTMTLFALFYVYGALAYDSMRDPQVFLNMLRAAPFLLISAVGMTFVIISGGIDLSVGGVVALTTVVSAALLRDSGLDPWLIMAIVLLIGMAFGATMGFFITYLQVQPFIATLAGLWVARGLCFFISDNAIPIRNRLYEVLAGTKLLIPGLADPVAKTGAFVTLPVVFVLGFVVVAMIVAHRTGFGRTVYAIGGNELSARLMGLRVNRTKLLVYTFNGLCSALAGIALSIDVGSGHGLYATGMELTVIGAVVIGGTLLTGGVGYVFGTLFGVLTIGVIQTLIQFNGTLSSWWTPIVVGALTLVFIGIQSFLAGPRSRRRSTRASAAAADQPAVGPS